MKQSIKRRLANLILPHLPAVINPKGHLPPSIKRLLLFFLRNLYTRKIEDLHVVKIRMGLLKGKRMLLNFEPKVGPVNTEYLAGYRQEKEEAGILKKLVSQGETIWDIGIYRGFYSLLFSDLVGPEGIINAIDIDEKNCKVVTEVARINKITNISVYNYGISNENRESHFISSPSSNSRLTGTFRGDFTDSPVLLQGEKISSVQLRTLNSLFDELGPFDLLKIDIDGAELFALEFGDKIFSNPNLLFVIESHNYTTDEKITMFFKNNECAVYSINAKRFFKIDEKYWGTMVACKNEGKLKRLLSEEK